MSARPPRWRQALELGGLLCIAELLLTRFSGGQHVAPITAAVSVGAWAVLAAAPAVVPDLLPLPTRLRLGLHRLAGWGLCSIVGIGIIGPELNERGGRFGVAAGAVALVAAVALGSRVRSRSPLGV